MRRSGGESVAGDFVFFSAGHNVAEVENLRFTWLSTDRYLFLYIMNPCEVNDEETRENACIIYDIGFNRNYLTKKNFINSYADFVIPEELFKSFGIKPNVVFYPRNFEQINALLKKIAVEDARRGINHERLMYGYVIELLALAGRGAAEEESKPENENRRLLEEIRARYLADAANPPDIESLIAESALSRTMFYRMYQEYFHNSPKNDLIWARLNKARELMRSSELKIYEIAAVCGFENVGHFSRMFKKRYGYTPKNYQNAVRSETYERI